LTDASEPQESFASDGRKSGVTNSLRKTWALLALAFFAVLPVAFVSFRAFYEDVFPPCPGGLEVQGLPWSDETPGLERVNETKPFGATKDLLRVVADPVPGPVSRVKNGRIARLHTDASGKECSCGAIAIPWMDVTPWASTADVTIFRNTKTGVYYAKRGVTNSRALDGEILAAFKVVETPARHFQKDRLLSPSHLPALVSLLALGALGFAFVRSRRGIVYATRLHAWTEGELVGGGRVVSQDNGETLGVIATTSRRLVPGPVLVAPEAGGQALYREMRMLERRDVAMGSHALWRQVTTRGLRDARALAGIATACAAFGLLAQLLGA
jgi:hypothetical protein